MPCILPDEQAIPLADYGLSNLGRLKTYRNGLGLRYNRIMQTICAVHYNFSMSDADWDGLRHRIQGRGETEIRCSSILRFDAQFQAVVLVTALSFGASPAVDRSFLTTKRQSLFSQLNADTFYLPLPLACARGPCHRAISSRITSIFVTTAWPITQIASGKHYYSPRNYQRLTEQHGPAAQISPHILQSEAEFYTTVREDGCASWRKFFNAFVAPRPNLYRDTIARRQSFYRHWSDSEQIHSSICSSSFVAGRQPSTHPACDEVQRNFRQTVTEGRRHDIQLLNQARIYR